MSHMIGLNYVKNSINDVIPDNDSTRFLSITHPTTFIDRLLLMVIVALMPLQSELPVIGGHSLLFLMFGLLGLYLVLCQLDVLRHVACHSVFKSCFAFILFAYLMEIFHGEPDFNFLFRIVLMFVGAIFVAALCRDRKSLLWGLYGIILGSITLSMILFATSYGYLAEQIVQPLHNTGDGLSHDLFYTASRARAEAYEISTLKNDMNSIAFHIVQGSLIALVLAVTAKKMYWKIIFLAIGGFCAIGAFIPASRGAIFIFALTSLILLNAYGIMKIKVIAALGLVSIAILLLVPDVIVQRLTVDTSTRSGQHVEGRVYIYSNLIEYLPEYSLFGVGISDFHGKWGMNTKFRFQGSETVTGAHNYYAQVMIYWGIGGLVALIFVLRQTYRVFPRKSANDPLYLCLLSIAISVLIESLFTHVLPGKEFSIGLGLTVGSAYWIWHNKPVIQVLVKNNYNKYSNVANSI